MERMPFVKDLAANGMCKCGSSSCSFTNTEIYLVLFLCLAVFIRSWNMVVPMTVVIGIVLAL